MNGEKLKDPEHRFIWLEISHIRDELKNHVHSRLSRLEHWQWFIIGLIVTGILLLRLT